MQFIPYNLNLTDRARQNRANMSDPERKLWFEMLAGKNFLGLKFTRQKPIGDFILDFYCSEILLAIEVDGDSHFEPGQEKYDKRRTEILNNLGIQVVRVYNNDVIENLEGVWIYLAEAVEERKLILGLSVL